MSSRPSPPLLARFVPEPPALASSSAPGVAGGQTAPRPGVEPVPESAWAPRSMRARATAGGVAFWTWYRTRALRAFVTADALEALAGHPVCDPEVRLAAYEHCRKRIHGAAQALAAWSEADTPVVVTAAALAETGVPGRCRLDRLPPGA